MIHGHFEVQRTFDHPLRDLWRGYVDPDTLARWRRIPGPDARRALDLREGGHELLVGSFEANDVAEQIRAETHFIDIVEGRRLVYSFDLAIDGVRRWASLVTITFEDHDGSTLVTHHEQYVVLAYTDDGSHDVAHLRGSVNLAWNALAAALT